MISRRRWLVMSVCVVVWLACPRLVSAATCKWIGMGATNLWNDPANWNMCGNTHALPQNGDTLVFPDGAPRPQSVNNIAGLESAGISIATGAGDEPYTILGERITLTGNLAFTGATSGATGPVLLTPITLGANVQIENAGPGTTPAILGDLDLNGHDVFVGALDGPIFMVGAITGPAGNLTKGGSFDLLLSGANTYEGLTIVNTGNLVVASSSALGAAPASVSSGHTIIHRNATVTIEPGLTYAESFVGAGLSFVGEPGTLRLAFGQAELTGQISATGLQLRMTVDAGATLHVAGALIVPSEATLIKSGTGVMNVTGQDNTVVFIDIKEGVLRLGAAGALPDVAILMMDANSVLDLNNLSETIGTIRGSGAILLGSGTLRITGGSDGWIDGPISGTGSLIKQDTCALRLGGTTPNTFTGTTTLTEGAIDLAKTAGVPAIRGSVMVSGGTLRWSAPHQIDDGATIVVNTPGVVNMFGHDEDIGSLIGTGVVALGGTLGVGGTHASSLFAGVFFGPGALRKNGLGTLILTGIHGVVNFIGRADVAGGTLLITGVLPGVRLLGGVIGGSGRVGAIVAAQPGGGVSPGTSPGILSATRAEFASGTEFTVELNGPTPGTAGYDRLSLTGLVKLTGATLNATLNFVPAAGTTFTIIDVGVGPVDGTFAGLPQDASLVIGGRPFRISYTGGDGNDVVLTALVMPEMSISDVTVAEGHSGSTNAEFTVSLSTATTSTLSVQYATVNGTATSPQDYASLSGTLTFQPGEQSKTVTVAVHGDALFEPVETFALHLSSVQGAALIVDADGAGTITDDDAMTWYLAEGATGVFFDNDLLIANPTTTAAPVTLTFFPEGGSPIVDQRTIPAQSRVTVHVDQLAGLENASAAVQVASTDRIPLVVERTMFWDATYYGGHTGAAVTQASPTWFFAEASQGFFDTFVLITNANATAADVTLTFLREGEPPVVKTVPVGAASRVTIGTGMFSALVDRSFGLSIEATQPVIAERSMYFGSTPTHLWSGGHESPGVTQTATSWFHAEGATGAFFDTYILMSNPSDDEAHVTLDFLLEDGGSVRVTRTIPAKARVTVDIEGQADPRLRAGAVSTVVTSDRPIVSERSTYWAGDATPWGEGHNSFGLTETSATWGLAEGRVGGAHHFVTFILLANPQTTAADVTVTYLRETGAPIVKTYTLLPESRFTIGVNSDVPELADEAFGARIDVTNGVPIAVERSMYWDANGVFWAGGSHAPATRLP